MNAAPLPDYASVIVIGGGVMGCSVLYHLAREGVADALLLERGKIACGTTWHSAAQVRALRSGYNLTRLIRRSIELYAELEAETEQSAGWQNTGSLSIAAAPDRLVHLRRQERLAAMFGVAYAPLSAGEAKERWPLLNNKDILGATYMPADGRVGPTDLSAALAKGAAMRGARICEETAVRGLLVRGGKITGVKTDGGTIRCDAAVVAAGLWSGKLANAPLWPCEHFYLLTAPLEGVARGLPTLSDHDSHLYIRDDGGGLLVGCFETHARAINPERLGKNFSFQLLPEDWEHFAPLMEKAIWRVPALATAGAKTLVNGPESFTPDGMFLLGETAHTQNLFLACGMNSVGVASAGGAGYVLARRIIAGRAPFALPEAEPARFADEWNCAAALCARAPEVLGRHYEISYPARQMQTARNLQTAPLHNEWKKHRAAFGQFGEWERPLYFNHPPGADWRPTFARPPWHSLVGAEVKNAQNGAKQLKLSI